MQLSELQLDALQEIGNIGAGHAATALSQMVDRKILITVPEVELVPFQKVPEYVGGPETIVAGVYIPFFGDIVGSVLFLLPEESVFFMADLLRGQPPGSVKELTDTDKAMVQQAASILTASYLNALTRLTGLALVPSASNFAFDMAGAIVDGICASIGREADYALLVETEFIETTYQVRGQLFFVPEPDSLDTILERVGVR